MRVQEPAVDQMLDVVALAAQVREHPALGVVALRRAGDGGEVVAGLLVSVEMAR